MGWRVDEMGNSSKRPQLNPPSPITFGRNIVSKAAAILRCSYLRRAEKEIVRSHRIRNHRTSKHPLIVISHRAVTRWLVARTGRVKDEIVLIILRN